MHLEHRALAQLSKSALIQNFEILARLTRARSLLPMVKANAYGHGALWVTQTLHREFKNSFVKDRDQKKHPMLAGFGVATVSEALQIRKETDRPILIFSDGAPWTLELIQFYRQHRFEPVLAENGAWESFLKIHQKCKIPFHVELNTGMNRLGLSLQDFFKLQNFPHAIPSLKTVFTHLAQSESPKAKITQVQINNFKNSLPEVQALVPHCEFHFANSGAIFNDSEYSFKTPMIWARPGLSLYGIRPFERAPQKGLKLMMSVSAPILRNEKILWNESVGYAASYTSKKRQGEWVATVAAGYADGVFRAMQTGGGRVLLLGKNKKTCKIVGRVSMDLFAISSHAFIKPRDRVLIWGEGLDPYQVAKSAGTIPYEITTRLGERVERVEVR